jgi:hypothetical protein
MRVLAHTDNKVDEVCRPIIDYQQDVEDIANITEATISIPSFPKLRTEIRSEQEEDLSALALSTSRATERKLWRRNCERRERPRCLDLTAGKMR